VEGHVGPVDLARSAGQDGPVIYTAALLAAICFALVLRLLRIVPLASSAIARAADAARTMKDTAMSDADKERAARATSLALLGSCAAIAVRGVAAAAASAALLALFHLTGLARWTATTAFLASWPGIALASAAMVVAAFPRLRS
jgi:hypothetical protein